MDAYACDISSLNISDFFIFKYGLAHTRFGNIPPYSNTKGLICHCTIYCCSGYLPLRSNDPVVPSQLREAHVESLLATLAFYCTAAFDRSSSYTLHGCRIRTHD